MFSFWVLFCFFHRVFFYFGYKISERNKLAVHTRTAYFAPPCYPNHKQKLSDRSAVEGCSACSRTKLYEKLWPQYFIFTDLLIWLVYYNETPPQKKHFSWYLFTRLYFFGIFPVRICQKECCLWTAKFRKCCQAPESHVLKNVSHTHPPDIKLI